MGETNKKNGKIDLASWQKKKKKILEYIPGMKLKYWWKLERKCEREEINKKIQEKQWIFFLNMWAFVFWLEIWRSTKLRPPK